MDFMVDAFLCLVLDCRPSPFRGSHFRGGAQCLRDLASRFLVALPSASDLLLFAKHLFIAARTV
jgi:hypothetical protein